jgi:hypothetical protein
MGKAVWKSSNTSSGWNGGGLCVPAGFAALLTLLTGLSGPVAASPLPLAHAGRAVSLEATTSDAARRDALKSIPLDRLSTEGRAKVESVLSNISIFRRLPTRVVDCDPDIFLFLVRHPDVVVNIWEVFRISQLKVREINDGQFRVNEKEGATATFEFVYQSHDLHVIYAEGVYHGPLLTRPVKGRGVLVLKAGYVRETNGRYYITSRMDSFLNIEPAAAELVTKTVSPLLGKTVDSNFVQTLAFVGSLSRTAEVNSRGVQRLGEQLMYVQPAVREQFVELAAGMPEKQAEAAKTASPPRAAMRPIEQPKR